TNVPRTQAVRGTVEPSRKIFDGVDVTAYSFFRVIKTLEFLQHQFTKMGPRVPPCDPNLSQPTSNHCSVRLTRSVRRRAATSKTRLPDKWRKLRVPATVETTFLSDGLNLKEFIQTLVVN